MTDQSPDPQNPTTSPQEPLIAMLSQAQYQCSHCHRLIIQVEGNQLKFLMDSKDSIHARTSTETEGDDVYIVVELHHIDKPDIQPGH